MPSGKRAESRLKKSAKSATQSSALPSKKNEGDRKRVPKKLALKEGTPTEQDKLKTRRARATIRSSQWQREPTKLEQPKANRFQEDLKEKTELEKIIEEIESKGSSSEPEDFEQLKEESEPELNLAITGDIKMLDFDISSIEMSVSEEEFHSERPEKFQSETNFLDIFGKMPAVDEVSLDLLEETEEGEKPEQQKKQQMLTTKPGTWADFGTFLDPVTGLPPSLETQSSFKSLSVKILSDESVIDAADKGEHEELPDVQRLSLTEDISKDGSEKSTDDFETAGESLQAEENTFNLFMESAKPEEILTVEEIVEDHEAAIIEQIKLATVKTITELLSKLADHCVTKSEANQSEAVLRRSLNKYDLIRELKAAYELLEFERSKMQFLNKKSIIYFKRKGSLRTITADPPNTVALNRKNFLAALKTLGELIDKEEKTKILNSSQICILKQQFEEKKHESLEKVSKLEHLIKTTFHRKHFDKLRSSVERLVSKMSTIRNETSQVRFKLLLVQYQFAALKKELEKLEDLGNGLNVRQYELLQIETLAISKKIEEQDNTLNRLHRHLNDDLHKIAHAKEKKSIAKNITEAQKEFLEEVVEKQRLLRERIYQQKLQRSRLKHQINQLSHQAGLLSNPILLRDYDQTVEKANKLQQTNEDLRKMIEEITHKINELN